jgi:hypothetical protein
VGSRVAITRIEESIMKNESRVVIGTSIVDRLISAPQFVRTSVGKFLIAVGFSMTIAAFAAYITAVVLLIDPTTRDAFTVFTLASILTLLLLGYLAVLVGPKLWEWGLQLRQLTAVEILENKREYILFLRSFTLDTRHFEVQPTVPLWVSILLVHWPIRAALGFLFEKIKGPTAEEPLIHTFRLVAPVIAVGRPDERLPTIGASRVYINENDWRPRVQELIQGAKLILFTVSTTPGAMWELRIALEEEHLERVILYIPVQSHRWRKLADSAQVKPYSLRPREWLSLRDAIQPLISAELPERLVSDAIIFFRRDGCSWRSHVVEVQGRERSSSRQLELEDHARLAVAQLMGWPLPKHTSVFRRILVICAYLILALGIFMVVDTILIPPACLTLQTCEPAEYVLLLLVGTMFWCTAAVLTVWGWRGELWGCVKASRDLTTK